jgi:pimeloyl-ACP methyl ester carboxylesterase
MLKKLLLIIFTLTIGVTLMANTNQKKKLVFIPAFMTTEKLYEEQIKEFSKDYDITVILIKDFDNIQAESEHVYTTLKTKYSTTFNDDKFYMAGTSMGGMILMEFMRKYQNKVAQLALLNTNFNAPTPDSKKAQESYIAWAQSVKDSEFIALNDDILKMFIHNITPANKQKVYDMANSLGRITFINQNKLLLGRNDYSKDFSTYKVKTLVLGGEYDIIDPIALQQQMFNALPNGLGQLVIIKNSAHFSTIDNPNDVNIALKKWLN